MSQEQEAQAIYPRFWERFYAAYRPFAEEEPENVHFVKIPSSVDGVWFAFVVTLRQGARLELYIDKHDEELNDGIFRRLKSHKAEIEGAVGSPLVWHDEAGGNMRRRIDLDIVTSGIADEGEWEKVIDAFCQKMPRFIKAIEKFLR